jgi:hypothetical protein
MSTEIPPARPDPDAAAKVQILATEHWSLLATRSLTYTESLSRVTIFLSIVSGVVVALALVAQVSRLGPAFIAIAIPLLSVVAFTGTSTMGRLMTLNRDDFRWVVGMDRLRRAYLELHPELERYLVTGSHDDMAGVLQTLGIDVSWSTRVPVAARPAPGGDPRARTRRPAVAERHLLVGVPLLRARRGAGTAQLVQQQ